MRSGRTLCMVATTTWRCPPPSEGPGKKLETPRARAANPDGAVNVADFSANAPKGTAAMVTLLRGKTIAAMHAAAKKNPGAAPAKLPDLPPGYVELTEQMKGQHARQQSQIDAMGKSSKAVSARVRGQLLGKFDPTEHFLLADLDHDKDSLMFGETREEFYENVEKMKRVIIEYTRWERSDNFYLYATRLCQVIVAWMLYDTWVQESRKTQLASSLDNYRAAHVEDLAGIEERRHAAMARAILELEVRPPNFADLVARRNELEKDAGRSKRYVANPMDTMDQEREKHAASVEQQERLIKYALNPTSIPAVRNLRRIVLPQSGDWAALVREDMLAYRNAKDAKLRFPGRKDRAPAVKSGVDDNVQPGAPTTTPAAA